MPPKGTFNKSNVCVHIPEVAVLKDPGLPKGYPPAPRPLCWLCSTEQFTSCLWSSVIRVGNRDQEVAPLAVAL